MFTIILLVLLACFALWGGIEDYINEVKSIPKRKATVRSGSDGAITDKSNRFFSKKVVKAGLEGFVGNFLVGAVIGIVLWLVVAAFVFKAIGDPQVTKTEVYKIAPNSTFDQEPRRFTFTSVNEYGKL
jgi:hypothetical protein